MNVRVRFAPSPTGYLHMGSARTAIFNWIYARQQGGTMILRIEDTDMQRSSEEMVRGIIEGMEWLGIDYDEGPYFQSDYIDKHREAVDRLLANGQAYRDFTPKEERDDAMIKRQVSEAARQGKERNPWRDLPVEESKARAAAGEPFVVRLRVPEAGSSVFEDIIYGRQERDFSEIEDLALMRSDGYPLYNLSVVVDDITMRISHVIRGQDHLMNTHKQILIYRGLGAEPPQFAHLPLILAPGREKLSKRRHGEIVSITTYRDRGFVPEAFFNFLVLLGWTPPGGEVLSRQRMLEVFRLDAIHKSNAIFNFAEGDPQSWTDPKAIWMNGEYIKAMPLDDLVPLVTGELRRAGLWQDDFDGNRREWLAQTIALLRERYRLLTDFPTLGRPYFVESLDFSYEQASIEKNLRKDPALKRLLPGLAERYAALGEFTHQTTEAALREYAAEEGVKAGLLINAARTALTGQSVGPGMFDIIAIMGHVRTVERLRHAATLI